MSVYIYQPDALHRMSLVEGEAWSHLQQRNQNSPQGFYAWLRAWRRLEEEGYAGQVDVSIYVDGHDGCIYGEGGYSRYQVSRNGEIVLWRSSTRSEKIDLAEAQGFTIRG